MSHRVKVSKEKKVTVILPRAFQVLVRIPMSVREAKGLILPEKKHKWQESAMVVDVMETGNYVEEVSKGDRVLIHGHEGKWVDEEIFGDDKVYRFIDESDILALVTEVSTTHKWGKHNGISTSK